ncbi:hypothetical protein J3A83DRAFT_1030105 [Scleroderma citrinum]
MYHKICALCCFSFLSFFIFAFSGGSRVPPLVSICVVYLRMYLEDVLSGQSETFINFGNRSVPQNTQCRTFFDVYTTALRLVRSWGCCEVERMELNSRKYGCHTQLLNRVAPVSPADQVAGLSLKFFAGQRSLRGEDGIVTPSQVEGRYIHSTCSRHSTARTMASRLSMPLQSREKGTCINPSHTKHCLESITSKLESMRLALKILQPTHLSVSRTRFQLHSMD